MQNQNTLDRVSDSDISSQSFDMSYDAFGAVRSQTGTDTGNKNKFVGGYGILDDSDEDGLVFMRARYYDSELGRFISQDPIGELGGLNFYRYCKNNRASRKALYQLGS